MIIKLLTQSFRKNNESVSVALFQLSVNKNFGQADDGRLKFWQPEKETVHHFRLK
jgi:hypothetical protein